MQNQEQTLKELGGRCEGGAYPITKKGLTSHPNYKPPVAKWDEAHEGKTWRDMNCSHGDDSKKLAFALFRRGILGTNPNAVPRHNIVPAAG